MVRFFPAASTNTVPTIRTVRRLHLSPARLPLAWKPRSLQQALGFAKESSKSKIRYFCDFAIFGTWNFKERLLSPTDEKIDLTAFFVESKT